METTPLDYKKIEEVRKRRAKATPDWLNPYQKTALLLAGLLALFLAIGLGPRLAPLLAAGVSAGTLLLFLIVRNLKTKKEKKDQAASQETVPEGQDAAQPRPIFYSADVEIIADCREAITEQIDSASLHDFVSQYSVEANTVLDAGAVEKEGLSPIEEFSEEGVLDQIKKRTAILEQKLTNLEGMLLSQQESIANMQEKQLKSNPQIDLQSILRNFDEKEGKFCTEASNRALPINGSGRKEMTEAYSEKSLRNGDYK
jgi:hypothetical protein